MASETYLSYPTSDAKFERRFATCAHSPRRPNRALPVLPRPLRGRRSCSSLPPPRPHHIVVLEGFLSGFARWPYRERERERERREGRRIARLMASFFTRTHISASPLLPPACREGTSRHSRRRSAVTLHFGLPARNCRRVYNSCLSLGRVRIVRGVYVCRRRGSHSLILSA